MNSGPLDEQLNKKPEQEDELKTQIIYPRDGITNKRDILKPHEDGQGADLEVQEEDITPKSE